MARQAARRGASPLPGPDPVARGAWAQTRPAPCRVSRRRHLRAADQVLQGQLSDPLLLPWATSGRRLARPFQGKTGSSETDQTGHRADEEVQGQRQAAHLQAAISTATGPGVNMARKTRT